MINGTNMLLAAGQAGSDQTVSKQANTKQKNRLEEAAKGFETLMISQMMKSARESSGGGWLNDGDQPGEDSTMGMAEDQLAKTMADSGGLGLAKMVMRTMSHSGAGATAAPVTPTK